MDISSGFLSNLCLTLADFTLHSRSIVTPCLAVCSVARPSYGFLLHYLMDSISSPFRWLLSNQYTSLASYYERRHGPFSSFGRHSYNLIFMTLFFILNSDVNC